MDSGFAANPLPHPRLSRYSGGTLPPPGEGRSAVGPGGGVRSFSCLRETGRPAAVAVNPVRPCRRSSSLPYLPQLFAGFFCLVRNSSVFSLVTRATPVCTYCGSGANPPDFQAVIGARRLCFQVYIDIRDQ
jgi:hypothetical protein